VGVTDGEWRSFLAARPQINEVNFWRPSGGSFKILTRLRIPKDGPVHPADLIERKCRGYRLSAYQLAHFTDLHMDRTLPECSALMMTLSKSLLIQRHESA